MPEGLINQLMTCYWIEMGLEVESLDEASDREKEIKERLSKIRKRKVKFDF